MNNMNRLSLAVAVGQQKLELQSWPLHEDLSACGKVMYIIPGHAGSLHHYMWNAQEYYLSCIPLSL